MATRNTVNNTYLTQPDVINEVGGGNTTVQYNKNGSFAGDTGLRYNESLKELTVQGNINVGGWVKGKITTNSYNFFLQGGNSGQVLSTDGTGNLSWVDQSGGTGSYGNSNVANYLPTFAGSLSPSNIHVTTNSLLGDNSTPGQYFVYRDTNQVSLGQTAAQTININSNGITLAGTSGVTLQGVAGANVTIGGQTTGNVVFPDGVTFNDGTHQTTAFTGTATTDRLVASTASVILDSAGILTYPEGTTTTGSSIETPVGNTFSITTASPVSISAAAYIGLGDLFSAWTEFNDDITVVQVGWIVTIDGTDYTVTSVDNTVGFQYRITATGATFVTGTTYTFANPIPATHAWSINQYGVLTTPGSGTISQINNDFMIAVAGTDIIGLRTEGGDVIVDAAGNVNIPGQLISTTSVSRLSLNEQGGGGAYLTSTENDDTALFLRTTDVQMYSGINQTITAGVMLPRLETDYTDSVVLLEELFTLNSGEAGYPWGITLPVSYLTYNELILLTPGTFPNQTAVTTYAHNTNNLYELWQQTIIETNVTITSNENTWTYQGLGHSTRPNQVVEKTTNGVVCNAGAPTVIYTAVNSFSHTLKLLIQVEGIESGVSWDTQSCEMVVAKSFRNNNVVGSVYGLAYTSTNPLATFNALWNVALNRVQITCTPTSVTYGVEARVCVTEMATSD